MDNKKTRELIIICLIIINSILSIYVINNEIDKNRSTKLLNKRYPEATDNFKKYNRHSLSGIVATQSDEIEKKDIENSKLRKKYFEILNELRNLKKRFSKQIEAEKQKANIKWSDDSKKPKYNKVQEGIDWSNEK